MLSICSAKAFASFRVNILSSAEFPQEHSGTVDIFGIRLVKRGSAGKAP